MLTTACPRQIDTFFSKLENTPALDLRDSRGKQHSLAMVLMGLTLALLSKRDGCLSSLHRHLTNHYQALCEALERTLFRPISRPHLPILLQKVDGVVFDQLLQREFGIILSTTQKAWFGGDGKELRGSIEKGHKRGQAVVEIVSHQSRQVVSLGFYNGQKESERPVLQSLLAYPALQSQKLTFDALHFNPPTLELIQQAGGWYVVGLKANQSELYTDWVGEAAHQKPFQQLTEWDKGHGRLERRSYASFSMRGSYVDPRWHKSGLQTLLVVERERLTIKGISESVETHYYVSNAQADAHGQELFKAIRGHWSVETRNYCRDVSLQEDRLRTGKEAVSRHLARLRSVVLNRLETHQPTNRIAMIESFADDFQLLIKWARTNKLL